MPIRFLTTVTLFLVASTAISVAQAPSRIGTYRDWAAYVFSDGRGKVCYAASQPKDTKPAGVNRDPIFFMISSRPSESVRNEASIIIGYPLNEGAPVTATVDGEAFVMFAKGDGAWMESPEREQALVEAMKRGRSMVVTGTSRRGTNTTDTYSLSGVTAALETIAKECP